MKKDETASFEKNLANSRKWNISCPKIGKICPMKFLTQPEIGWNIKSSLNFWNGSLDRSCVMWQRLYLTLNCLLRQIKIMSISMSDLKLRNCLILFYRHISFLNRRYYTYCMTHTIWAQNKVTSRPRDFGMSTPPI